VALADATDEIEAVSHALVADLHSPQPWIFWTDLMASAALGWTAFVLAVAARQFSASMWVATVIAVFALYRGVCFTHELAHLRRRALPGFETAWNILFGVPLLLPSFTYLGVHQFHHSLSSYGTKEDPEYLPFASSRRLMIIFAIQSTLLMPIAIIVRFLLLAPIGLVWRPFHRWLEVYASSFAMNPEYRRAIGPEMVAKMRHWEMAMLAVWGAGGALIYMGALPVRTLFMWLGVLTCISLLNTLRVMGAHEYDSRGAVLSRHGQLSDSIDTPGGPWTGLWAPVGLRYHALHHYFPGIPYHNLGTAYRRIVASLPRSTPYLESTSPSLAHSLRLLYSKATRAIRG
jgi:fatty acid desaturase